MFVFRFFVWDSLLQSETTKARLCIVVWNFKLHVLIEHTTPTEYQFKWNILNRELTEECTKAWTFASRFIPRPCLQKKQKIECWSQELYLSKSVTDGGFSFATESALGFGIKHKNKICLSYSLLAVFNTISGVQCTSGWYTIWTVLYVAVLTDSL